jgi:hypothetical protein
MVEAREGSAELDVAHAEQIAESERSQLVSHRRDLDASFVVSPAWLAPPLGAVNNLWIA